MDGLHVLNQFRVDGKRALVTGGSKGLGKVMATALAAAGAEVALCSRHADEVTAAAREISEATGKAVVPFVADVTNSSQVELLREQVGAVDILVNNAGNNTRGPIQDLSEADWDTVVDTNLKGPFLVSRAFGPDMVARGWGRVINMGSILSLVGIAGRVPYCSAKAGLVAMTRVLALEWAGTGVTANALGPGPFATDMNKPILEDPERYKAFISKIPMGRWGELNEIAGPLLFLASDASSFVTGTTLYVDGGWTAQ